MLVAALVPKLAHILYLLFIMLVIFSVVSVQLWSGIMRRRCFSEATGEPD